MRYAFLFALILVSETAFAQCNPTDNGAAFCNVNGFNNRINNTIIISTKDMPLSVVTWSPTVCARTGQSYELLFDGKPFAEGMLIVHEDIDSEGDLMTTVFLRELVIVENEAKELVHGAIRGLLADSENVTVAVKMSKERYCRTDVWTFPLEGMREAMKSAGLLE